SIGITLDQAIFVERGEVASHQQSPPPLTNAFRARLFWLGSRPLKVGDSYILKLLTGRFEVKVETVERVIDTGDLSSRAAESVDRNEIGEVVLRTRATILVDAFSANTRTGRFVLVDDFRIVGGGIIDLGGFADMRARPSVKSRNITPTAPRVALADHWQANG